MAALIFLLIAVVGIYQADFSAAREHDFNAYWAATQAFLDHANLYDAEVVGGYLKRRGLLAPAESVPIAYSLPLVYPVLAIFLAFDYELASALYFIFFTLALVFAILLASKSADDSPRLPIFLGALFCVSFLPVVISLRLLQISALALVSISIFWLFARKFGVANTFWGGLALALVAYKVQLIAVLLLAILVASFYERKCHTLVGFGGGLFVLGLLAEFLHPGVWGGYLQSISLERNLNYKMPTLSSWIFMLGAKNHFLNTMILFSFAGSSFLVLGRRLRFNSSAYAALAIIVSPLFAIYAWTYDFVLLIPVCLWLLARGYKCLGTGSRAQVQLAVFILGINYLMFLLPLDMFYGIFLLLFWMLLAMLIIGGLRSA